MKFAKILTAILLFMSGKAFAESTLWPELAISMGSSKVVGEVSEQSPSSYDLSVMIWGSALPEVDARSGYFGFEFGGYQFENKGTQFIGGGEAVNISTTTIIPYVRLMGTEASYYLLAGVGIRLSSLMVSSKTAGDSEQTFGSYLLGLQYLYRLTSAVRIGVKLNWSAVDQVLNDKNSFFETTQTHFILSYQP